jgi:hypothetical protein
MQRARTRNGDLGKQLRFSFEKVEIGDIDRMGPAHTAFDERNRLGPTPTASRRAFGMSACDGIDAQIPELLIEKTVIRPAAEFAVGRKTQAEAFLQAHRA